MKIKIQKIIDSQEWDKTVQETYGRPYCFQQQNWGQDSGLFHFKVPAKDCFDEEMNDEIPEESNHSTKGIKFAKWLAREPKAPLKDDDCGADQWCIDMWWHRNFYPDVQTIANDLHAKGLLEAGSYAINID